MPNRIAQLSTLTQMPTLMFSTSEGLWQRSRAPARAPSVESTHILPNLQVPQDVAPRYALAAPRFAENPTNSPSHQAMRGWVGVTKFVGGNPGIWAQMGYARDRAAGSTTIRVERYAETNWGPGPNDRDYFTETGVPSGTHEYKCYLLSSLLGTWKYEFDGLPFRTFTHNNWRNVTGTHYQYGTEIFNKEDQMVGTAASKCNYTECKYSVSWGAFQDANITSGNLHTDDPSEWGIERVSSTAFNVWDKNP